MLYGTSNLVVKAAVDGVPPLIDEWRRTQLRNYNRPIKRLFSDASLSFLSFFLSLLFLLLLLLNRRIGSDPFSPASMPLPDIYTRTYMRGCH